MLKGIPKILSPHLLKVLAEMGHGDQILLADGNFPSQSMGNIVIRADGHGTLALLEAILQLFPLDDFVEKPVTLMRTGDDVPAPIWASYTNVIQAVDKRGTGAIETIERFEYYALARSAYAIVATGEGALYANIMLQKGVIRG